MGIIILFAAKEQYEDDLPYYCPSCHENNRTPTFKTWCKDELTYYIS